MRACEAPATPTLASGWQRARLGDVADVSWGDTSTTKASYVAQGYVAYSASGPDGYLPYADYDRTGVVLSAIGADCGKTWLAKGRWSCIKNTMRFWATDPSVSTEFLYWLTRDPTTWPKRGSAQPFISQGDARAIQVTYPPLNDQRAIARILGALDDKIELNRRMSDTLEAMARSLFKSWFVDFDPVRARVEGRPTGLPVSVAEAFPSSFVGSPGGPLPAGWRVGGLAEVLSELEAGRRPPGGVARYATGVPSIGAESIVGLGRFDYSKTKYIPEEFYARMSAGQVKNRDVLLYKDGGRPGEFEPHVTLVGDGFPFDTCAINEHVYRLRARYENWQNLLFFWLSSDLVMDGMRMRGTGVAVPGLNSTAVRELPALVPPDAVVRAFDSLVEPMVSRVLAASLESRVLARLRDTLLPRLISGELRLPEAERVASGVGA